MKKKVLGLLIIFVVGVALLASNPIGLNGVETNKADASNWAICVGDGSCWTWESDRGLLWYRMEPIYPKPKEHLE